MLEYTLWTDHLSLGLRELTSSFPPILSQKISHTKQKSDGFFFFWTLKIDNLKQKIITKIFWLKTTGSDFCCCIFQVGRLFSMKFSDIFLV